MTTPIIKLRGLTKTYGKGATLFTALSGIDLTVTRGERIAVMGPRGSGKSTLLNLLGCLDSPSWGNYQYEGIAVERLNPDQRALLRRHAFGTAFQRGEPFARATALDYVKLPLLDHGLPRRDCEDGAREALEAVGLGDKPSKVPTELSPEELQRVSIARAIVTRPLTLLVEEPTGCFGNTTPPEVIDLLMNLASTRRSTLIMVTQESHIAATATRVIQMRAGRLAADSAIAGFTPVAKRFGMHLPSPRPPVGHLRILQDSHAPAPDRG